MSRRPGRARMCSWLAAKLSNIGQIRPFNVMDIKEMARRADIADQKIAALGRIAGELGWHADASLDEAWILMQEYDNGLGKER